MVKLKFLVTGSAGLIGRQIVKDLSETHEVFSCYDKSKPEYGNAVKMDLLNHEMISNVLLETETRCGYSSWCNDWSRFM